MNHKPLALAFPLNGSQLIEASAGTGKTFTISALYLRLVLGHGSEGSGFGRELLPPQILVVTFTDAATPLTVLESEPCRRIIGRVNAGRLGQSGTKFRLGH